MKRLYFSTSLCSQLKITLVTLKTLSFRKCEILLKLLIRTIKIRQRRAQAQKVLTEAR
jgi:hypothetical protein